MDRLIVSLLNTARREPDALASALGAARWWASVQGCLTGAIRSAAGKPRFDGRLAAELRALRARVALALERDCALDIAFTGSPASDAIIFPVAYAALNLLAGPRRGRVRCCAYAACGMLFLDETKNGSRVWCSLRCMERARVPRRRTIAG